MEYKDVWWWFIASWIIFNDKAKNKLRNQFNNSMSADIQLTLSNSNPKGKKFFFEL